MSGSANREALLRLLAPVVADAGLDLEDVVVTPAGRRRLVRVVVDRDGGVQLDDVATVSQAVSAALDEADPMGGAPYTLEVTSPGVDRPLTEHRHWRRATGRLVRAGLADGTTMTGRVEAVDDHGVVLDVDGVTRELAWAELGAGRVQVEFSRGGAPAPAAEDAGGGEPAADVDEEA
jgi:ribosome maturation factor RimP